jgi:hypothetical protein
MTSFSAASDIIEILLENVKVIAINNTLLNKIAKTTVKKALHGQPFVTV